MIRKAAGWLAVSLTTSVVSGCSTDQQAGTESLVTERDSAGVTIVDLLGDPGER